ncbi:MAG: DVUA0089 family protein, partial [Phycisphaerales bacterium]|nr:DVUA0089 family protein [Phycisphaerales bacterium]
PLTVITGTNGTSDADLYRIQIDAPGSFSASTCNGAGFDTQLFLFDANGRGVVCNDDTCGAQSTLANARVTTAGVYYLAITNYDRDPISLGGLIFPNTSSGELGPTGPGGGLPLAGWSGAPASGGAYTITLTGCSHASAARGIDYGTGAGSAPGVPTLTTAFPPQLGNNASLTLTNPDPTAAGMALVLGLSRTSLPFMNGTIYVGNMVTVLSLPAPALGANTIGPFRLGRSPATCGSTVTWQMIVLVAPTVNFPTGLAWTNATEWTFGL